ncbi:MAG TPA: TolC family protein [Blastocatellia bacterium]|jgi:cobalt-zinc-cadmium efflux system outer membrane protein|nr:TolC family protein [Blastocatellia bacterium]
MKRSRAKFVHRFILPVAMILPLAAAAQTPAPIQLRGVSIPRKLTLAQAERLLLQRNLTVLATKYQVDALRAARLIASFRPNPTLTLGGEQFILSSAFFRDLFRTNTNTSAETTYTVRYEQLIERGGKREIRTEQADCQFRAGEAQMLDAARTELYQLQQAFTSAALARDNLLLAEATRQEYDRTIKLTEAKVENGDLARVELFRAQVAALPYQQAVQQARTSYQQATRDILNLLGARVEDVSLTKPAGADNRAQIVQASFHTSDTGDGAVDPDRADSSSDAPLEIDFKFDDRPISQTLAELRAIALAERPDVIASRYLYSAATKAVALASSQRTRDLLVGAFYQHIGSDNTVGVNVSFPLFAHNKGYAAISQAAAQQESAVSLARDAELQAVTDVEKAYLAYQSARRILDIYSSSTIERAGRLKTIAAISYKEGATGLLELLDAERCYNQTISSYNQARADYQAALWQLEQAIGRPLR